MIKLYVDDLRSAPEGWHLARTITEAIRVIDTMDVTEVSLDHDIGNFVGHELTQNMLNEGITKEVIDKFITEFYPHETFEPVARFIKLINRIHFNMENVGWGNTPPIKVYCHSGNPIAYDKYSKILGEPIQPLPGRFI